MALDNRVHMVAAPRDMKWGLRQGALWGIVAGLLFAAFEMMATAFLMGIGAFFMPLRMISAIVLGQAALDPGYSLLTAGSVGVIVHMVLSIVYGMVFGALAARTLRGQMAYVGLGSLLGLALWLVNFYVIAPMAFPWFLEANPIVQFIAHTFFFGTVLGYSLWKARENTAADGTRG